MANICPEITRDTTLQGRYRIVSVIAQGGFGSVLKGYQCATGQAVAIKVLRLDAGGAPEARAARFQREMQLCGKLHHPNVMRLIDSGQTDDGAVFIVFEFAPGKTLSDVLAEEGALDPAEARHLMLEVLDALCCAHEHGVIHRDLKPANVMVVPSGARRNALVLDFGIAAIAEGARGDDYRRITATGEIVCTPGYAAPEQLRGLPPTPRSDIFAWGLVFLECLSGRPVFRGSLQELIARTLDPEPIRLPAELRDHPLGEILRRATIKDVAARGSLARDLLLDLEACEVRDLRGAASLGRGARAVTRRVPTAASIEDLGGAGTEAVAPTDAWNAPTRGLPCASRPERQRAAVLCHLLHVAGGAAADAAAIDGLIRVQQQAVAAVVRSFGGCEVGAALGVQAFFRFSGPHAGEDPAIRAARAALAIRDAVRDASEALGRERSLRIELRIGLHTAPEEAGPCDDARALRSLPIAAQLAAIAAPFQIAVDAATRAIVAPHFTVEPGCVLRLEAPRAAPPLEVSLLVGPRAADPRDGAPERRPEGRT